MKTLDLFCTVIDNFGDIGVCRRLALQLHREYGYAVRLWVDDLTSFARLEPALDIHAPVQTWRGLEIRHWTPNATEGITPGDRIIEGFGCRLPDNFLQAMSARKPAPVWINLEYLSAEDWTLGCHGLPSPHPQLPLKQHFFFPGFDPRGGGLPREQDLIARRDAFQRDAAAQAAFWQRLGCPEALNAARRLSLFAYENPATTALLEGLKTGSEPDSSKSGSDPVFLAVPEGRALADVCAWAGQPLRAGDRIRRNGLCVAVLPFLSPEDYDRLLWACDLNIVRGEDSFVRAHWAGRPLIWHIYPQEDAAHLPKLEAWLAQCRPWLPESWRQRQRDWNHGLADGACWRGLFDQWPEIAEGSRQFCAHLAAQPDLAARLEEFCAER